MVSLSIQEQALRKSYKRVSLWLLY